MTTLAEVGWRERFPAQLKNVSLRGAYFTSDASVKRGEIMSVPSIVGILPLISRVVLPRLQGTVVRTDAGGFAILLASDSFYDFAGLDQFYSLLLKRQISYAAQ